MLSSIPNLYVICAGRVVYGFVAGVMVVASPKILGETVPTHVMDKGFGIATNLSINFYIMVSMFLGMIMPTKVEELA